MSTQQPAHGPTFDLEQRAWDAGVEFVVGMDEVGRGAWAGPVTVGAVALSLRAAQSAPSGVRDSKRLSPARREQLFHELGRWLEAATAAASVGHASAAECDQLGMTAAIERAARRALEALTLQPDAVLVDGKQPFVDHPATTAVVGGDDLCWSIAAASVIAKVTRDRLMTDAAATFAPYGFERNKGYPAPVHRAALASHGPCAVHRMSWSPLAAFDDLSPLWRNSPQWATFPYGPGGHCPSTTDDPEDVHP